MEDNGSLIRLFPVPFRLVRDDQQFKKWQWITAQVYKAGDDHRPESHKIYVDTIVCDDGVLSTKRNWSQRREAISTLNLHADFTELDAARLNNGTTLGLVRPSKVLGLDITPAESAEWTEDEIRKLVQHEKQAGFFDEEERQALRTLRKVPFAFHYRYECRTESGLTVHRHKIADWEAGALYWNCRQKYGSDWEPPFRNKLEKQLGNSDLMFLMGTIHRFPDQWLIVSLIYPPSENHKQDRQGLLAL